MEDQLMENANIKQRMLFINSLDTIVLSMLLSLGFSVLFCVLVQCFPKAMNWAVPFLALAVILALSICLFAYFWEAPGKTIIAIVLLVSFLVILFGLIRNRYSVRMNGVFLHNATKMLGTSKRGTFAYIPFFLAFLIGFIFLIMLEFRAYWTAGSLGFDAT